MTPAIPASDPAPIGAGIVFSGGMVFDGHAYLGRADVLIRGDRIVAVGDPGTLPTQGVEVVDAAGGLVMPGFIDAARARRPRRPGADPLRLVGADRPAVRI